MRAQRNATFIVRAFARAHHGRSDVLEVLEGRIAKCLPIQEFSSGNVSTVPINDSAIAHLTVVVILVIL